MKISGPAVAKLRNRLALTQREFGDKAGLGETRVRVIEKSQTSGVFMPTFRKMAEAAGLSVSAFRDLVGAHEVEIRQEAFEQGMKTSLEIQQHKPPVVVREREPDTFDDRSVEPYSEVRIGEIPLFEASLAAGPWIDVSEIGEVTDPRMFEHGMFRVRLAGDSMRPLYKNGEVVEFRCLRVSREGPMEGKDYYVQRDDGCATFKRIGKLMEDTITLVALNKRKYPQAMIVERSRVVRMAVAVAKVELLL